jgi:hypothetical protein
MATSEESSSAVSADDLHKIASWLDDAPNCPLSVRERTVLAEIVAELLTYRIDGALLVGTDVVKLRGYGFPGEVRAAFTNRAGELRYVVEAVGHGYAGMLHIFAPDQVQQAPTCPFCGKPHAGHQPCRHCGEPDIPDPMDIA